MRAGSLKASATLRLAFRTRQQTKAVAAALAPELQHPAGEKARARIHVRGKKMSLQFSARDSTILRAIVSSYLRMLAAALNVSNSLIELELSRYTDRGNKGSKRHPITTHR